MRQKSFLWADDLSSYDSIFSWTEQIPFISSTYGNHISLFTLLMAASTIVYSVINQKQMPTQQGMPSMKLMIYLFPIMMLFFLNNFSAGLSYYYLLANVISILQMTVLKSWFVDEEKIRNKLLMNMKTPKKKSKWQQRLEDVQKQQQTAKRKRRSRGRSRGRGRGRGNRQAITARFPQDDGTDENLHDQPFHSIGCPDGGV